MGLVKREIENLTYDIIQGLDIEDTDDNYGMIFRWSMGQDLKQPHELLKEKFKQEHPITTLTGGKNG